jgi:hypothetical protein
MAAFLFYGISVLEENRYSVKLNGVKKPSKISADKLNRKATNEDLILAIRRLLFIA